MNDNFLHRLLGIQKNLFNFACQLTADRELAHDLLQETTLKALTNREKYIENVNFKGWIFTIMRNLFINNYRQNVRKATFFDTTQNLFHLNISQDSGVSTPEGSYAVKEIAAAIASFTPDLREPFNMYVTGYKYAEIAEKLNLPLGTVKSRIFIVRKKLQTMLKDYR